MEILLVLGAVLLVMLCDMYRKERREKREEEAKWMEDYMLTEAEGVILDFLDCGKSLSQATRGKYQGTVGVRAHIGNRSKEISFSISMYDSGDLSQLDGQTLEAFHLTAFAKRYGYYYDPERDAIVYQSSIGIPMSQGKKEELERRLSIRIQQHPLALVKSDTLIYTRGI